MRKELKSEALLTELYLENFRNFIFRACLALLESHQTFIRCCNKLTTAELNRTGIGAAIPLPESISSYYQAMAFWCNHLVTLHNSAINACKQFVSAPTPDIRALAAKNLLAALERPEFKASFLAQKKFDAAELLEMLATEHSTWRQHATFFDVAARAYKKEAPTNSHHTRLP